MLVHSLTEPEEQPCFNPREVDKATTWQLLLTAQLADPVTTFFIQALRGGLEDSKESVNADDMSDEFKVIFNQRTHLSLAGEVEREVPRDLLFYKKSRSVAPASIQRRIILDAHNAGHMGITKTYNAVRAIFWWPDLFSDVKRTVD